MQPMTVIKFWFETLTSQQWWVKDPDLDGRIRAEFGEVHLAASRCELFEWRSTAEGRLAEIIVLDQFSRNIWRDTAQAFAADSLALAFAQEAVSVGHDQTLSLDMRSFLYMPYMHSESSLIHEQAV
ncbi:Uncharacterised protein [BD1-7 clade bacterium]|uniref:DUF924 domain-containing protein n=1 Tax=BD1-7 clade bacterium TaxID=2029982 RepID=A0A5S9PTX6_9GAMM|nr:Uncharacterised protein [BD1-7 clade bacterium]